MPEQKVFDYEHMAIRGEEMPDGLPSYDQTMFLNLRSLYDQYRTHHAHTLWSTLLQKTNSIESGIIKEIKPR